MGVRSTPFLLTSSSRPALDQEPSLQRAPTGLNPEPRMSQSASDPNFKKRPAFIKAQPDPNAKKKAYRLPNLKTVGALARLGALGQGRQTGGVPGRRMTASQIRASISAELAGNPPPQDQPEPGVLDEPTVLERMLSSNRLPLSGAIP
eukprot:6355871-Prymnesium_polylepis.1